MYSVFSLLAALPLVSALTMNVPTNPTSGGTVQITWSSASGDPPVFSLELENQSFHNSFAIANNVDTSLGSLNVLFPIVPVGDGYALEAVNIGNITDVYAQSGDFAIGALTSVSLSSTPSQSGTSSGTASITSGSSTTSSPSVTVPVPSPTTTTTQASTATGSAFSSSGSVPRFAFTATNAGAVAIVVLAGLAGAAVTL